MKRKPLKITLMIILLLILAFGAVVFHAWYTRGRGSNINLDNAVQAEDFAPDFNVQLLTGETFTLSDHRGTVVVLDFWATWCGPCVQKMPTVQALHEQFEGSVIFVGMNVGEQQSRVQEFIDDRGFTFPIGLDAGTIHRELYPSPGIPYMVIINGDGVISDTFLGGGANMHARIEAAILAALG